MQIFETIRAYVLAFCAYAFVALATVHNLFRSTGPSVTPSPFSIQFPAIVGMLCCAIVLPGLLRKTTNTLEKVVLILTEAVCLLWLANMLPKIGLAWAAIPHEPSFSALLVSAAAVLVGVRLFEVMRQRKADQGV
jgi:hypothetical protein